MKTIYVFLAIITAISLSIKSVAQAPNTWLEKADFGGNYRVCAVGFSIGAKGYIGTGVDKNNVQQNDFWEYDTITNAWSQEANFGGTGRLYAVGFSIGAKGYIGTGQTDGPSVILHNDFWEYDPISNFWTRKADFGGSARSVAVGFNIGNKGYIGTGEDTSFIYTHNYTKDFWEYDPALNTWTKKADFGGAARDYAVGFGIGGKGYIGIGEASDYYSDFWEYDTTNNTWTQKADFAGLVRFATVGFNIGNKGFVGTGDGPYDMLYNDFWEYDPNTNIWSQKTNFGGIARCQAVGFSIGSKGFIGTGDDIIGVLIDDFWEYTPSNPCPLPPPPINTTPSSNQSICSGHSTTLYASGSGNLSWYSAAVSGTWLGGGPSFNTPLLTSDTVVYVQDSTCAASASRTSISVSVLKEGWSQKADFSGGGRYLATGFSISNTGYIGTGWASGFLYNDFWAYDQSTNVWTQKADFGGVARYAATGLSIGNKGYIATGIDESTNKFNDFWEYDPILNSWSRKADFSGSPRFQAVGFSIAGKGYIGTGSDDIHETKDFWEYDPALDHWSQKADYSGIAVAGAVGFSIGNFGFIGTGFTLGGVYETQFWAYDPSTNSWSVKSPFGGQGRFDAVGFSIDSKGYIGTGETATSLLNDFWEYDSNKDTWSQKANCPNLARFGALGFNIGSKGYIVSGTDSLGLGTDLWEYTPSCSCTPPNISFISCFDTITTINARPIKLKGGIPLGGTYSGPGVDSLTGIFTPSIAGVGTKTVAYTYTNVDSCSGSKNIHITVQPSAIFTCGNNLTDIRDNKVYPSIKIGSQCWLSSNLYYGTTILSSQVQRDNCIAEKYCYNDNPTNCTTQGGLYQWDELMQYDNSPGVQGFCPPGWHIPSETEWNTLFSNWTNNAFSGSHLKNSGSSGFNAFLFGVNHFNISWDFQGVASFFWSSTLHGPAQAWAHGLNNIDPSVSIYPSSRANAFSVRCLQD